MTSLRFALPFNWMSIDLASNLEAQVDESTARLTADVSDPATADQARSLMKSAMVEQLSVLAAQNAMAYILEADAVVEVRTGVSLVVTPMPLPNGTDPLDWLLAIAARTPGARVLEVDQAVILRTQTEHDATAEASHTLTEQASRAPLDLRASIDQMAERGVTQYKVTYYVGRPDDPDSWVIVMATLNAGNLPEQRDLASAVLTVCDDVVSSVRWE